LDPKILEAYYSDALTEVQVRHFMELSEPIRRERTLQVADLGGGFGHFAHRVQELGGARVRVIDTDPTSVEACRERGLGDARLGDALSPPILGDEDVASFNLILHHLVGDGLAGTRRMQARALAAWKGHAEYVFINEYVYESPLYSDFAGKFTYVVTSNKLLSKLASAISRLHLFRALRANTFGVGVRFRSDASWRGLFKACGYEVVGFAAGPHERMPLARRLFARRKRRDSYLLKAC
jgi:hypothetical protein